MKESLIDGRKSAAAIIADIVQPSVVDAIMRATQCCLTCDHFRENPNELCGLYGKRPPARVIAFGCPAYENEIPF